MKRFDQQAHKEHEHNRTSPSQDKIALVDAFHKFLSIHGCNLL